MFTFQNFKLQNGEMLVDGMKNKVFFEKEGQTRKLIIRSISVHDDGEYTCSLGDQECTAEINVIGRYLNDYCVKLYLYNISFKCNLNMDKKPII